MAIETGLQLRSLLRANGELELSLQPADVGEPGADEVIVRVEAAPINPSDLGLLIGPADMSKAKASGSGNLPVVTAPVPQAFMRAMAGRIDQSLPAGNEGAGVVVRAGTSEAAKALLGKTVALFGGAMYAQYRRARAEDCLVLPEGTSALEGAACFVNPLTALGMVGTMRLEHHTALVHTAAASNLGQMLVKLCRRDHIELVNIVRKPEQAELLRGLGAQHVCDSSTPDFMESLIAALAETGATIAFDAIGGGKLVSQILTGMEAAAMANGGAFNRYGSATHKQVYIYGGLDMGPTELTRSFGFAWGLGGWLLPQYLAKIGPTGAQALREEVASELKTTFASHYAKTVSLAGALNLDAIAVYNRRATGEKYLIDPSLD
jgi:NADPH:quinone reductase-like Zn-dependent oxidoreductase